MAPLKIYIDENVDIRIAEGLSRRGIKAFSSVEKGKTGAADLEHFQYACDTRAVIFTHDHHFLEIARKLTKEGKTHYGVIFVEMNKLSLGEIIRRLALYAEILTTEEMVNRIEFL